MSEVLSVHTKAFLTVVPLQKGSNGWVKRGKPAERLKRCDTVSIHLKKKFKNVSCPFVSGKIC